MKFQKGHTINVGRKQTKTHRFAIGLSNKGKKRTKVQNERNRIAHLGVKYTPERIEKMKIISSGEGNGMFGKKQSEKTKQIIREKATGRKQSIETINKRREWNITHPNKKFKDTGIELKIEEELKNRGINYQKHVPLCKVALVDFYLPEYRIVIQCDGDYWHKFPVGKEKDAKQDAVLTFNGFSVYRFWEHEINTSASECINKIIIL
jgi:very-short-patch-repair endonuclease